MRAELNLFLIIGVLSFGSILKVSSQPTASFTVQLSACMDETLSLDNSSTSASSFIWDFCNKDLTVDPAISNVTTLPVTGSFYYNSLKIVSSNGVWIGFATDASGQNLFRLNFNSGLASAPAIDNLGNLGGILSSPGPLDIVEEGGTWYIFILNIFQNKVARVTMGDGLQATPTLVEDMGNLGASLNTPIGIKIISSGSTHLLFISNLGNNKIELIDFGASFSGSAIGNQTISDPLINQPGGIDIISTGSAWYGLVSSFGGGDALLLNFGASLFDPPSVASIGSVPNGRETRLLNEGLNYTGFIRSENDGVYRVRFGADFLTPVLSRIPTSLLQNDSRSLEIIKDTPNWKGYTIEATTGKLLRMDFVGDCNSEVTIDASNIISPSNVGYKTSGNYYIELTAIDQNNFWDSLGKIISISALPAPDISFSTQNVCANHDINFTSTNTSGDIADYNWDFGDTNTSILQDPTHQYAAATDYSVSLQVTASNGCNNLARDAITIYNQPVSNFDLPTTSPICTNQPYLFANTSIFDLGSNPSWQWEINGTPVSSDQELTYAIPSAVQQDIKLIATIPGCSNEIIKTINTVEVGPLADFIFLNDCMETSIDFTNTTTGTITGYAWDFGDTNTSNQTNGSNTYSNFGQFDVTLEATNAVGCVNSIVKPITVYSKPLPDFSIDLPPFSCSGSLSQFNDLTPNPVDSNLDSWVWSFGDVQNGTSIIRNPQYTYALAGDFNVNLDVTTNFGCVASVQKSVTITQSPSADFSFSSACVNQATTFTPTSNSGISSWQWKIGSTTYNQQSPVHVFSGASTYNVELSAFGSNNCIAILTKPVLVPVVPNLDFSSTNNCSQQSAIFTDITPSGLDPTVERQWQFGTLGSGTGPAPTFVFPTSGDHPTELTITNASGCSYSITKNVTITKSPIVTFDASPQVGTPPLDVQLANTTPNVASQLWTFNDPANSTSTIASPNFTFNEFGQYEIELTVINLEGCAATSSKTISVIVPTFDIELKNLVLIPTITGETNLLVTLFNKSNTQVSDLKAVISISGEAQISEVINTVIQPGESYSQILTTGIVGAKGETDYICVEMIVDGDTDNSNNKKCVSQEATTIVIDPYPNPGSDQLNLEWIAMKSGNADIYIFDSTGRKVFENTFSNFSVGLNRLTISLSSFNPGIYYVFFVSDNTRKSFPFSVRK